MAGQKACGFHPKPLSFSISLPFPLFPLPFTLFTTCAAFYPAARSCFFLIPMRNSVTHASEKETLTWSGDDFCRALRSAVEGEREREREREEKKG